MYQSKLNEILLGRATIPPNRFSPKRPTTRLISALEALGYKVNRWQNLNMYFGGTHALALEDGRWVAVGDRRRGGDGVIVK